MKLVRYGPPGTERPGVVDAYGILRDLSAHVNDITVSMAPLASGLASPALASSSASGSITSFHAAEAGMTVPSEPVVFMKATSAIVGPADDIEIPRQAYKTDWEVELAVVIGRSAKYVDPEQALDYVAGYCVVNDVSEREFQLEHQGQWTKGKSHDTFGPIGPWLVTKDEIADPQNLNPVFLKDGDRVSLGIECLGEQMHRVVAAK